MKTRTNDENKNQEKTAISLRVCLQWAFEKDNTTTILETNSRRYLLEVTFSGHRRREVEKKENGVQSFRIRAYVYTVLIYHFYAKILYLSIKHVYNQLLNIFPVAINIAVHNI